MITSRRDYILRIIDEVTRVLARIIFKRRAGSPQEALQSLVEACERLFSLEADKLFQFTPEQHYGLLTRDEPPEIARDKVLLYGAILIEAGQIYTQLGKREMARASFLNALRLTLRAENEFGTENLPQFAPSLSLLRDLVAGEPLDPETAELLRRVNE